MSLSMTSNFLFIMLSNAEELDIELIFKGSYKKANRTSLNSFTGINEKAALKILKDVRDIYNVPVTTDVHETKDCKNAMDFVDVLQIPAFLCRQNSFCFLLTSKT